MKLKDLQDSGFDLVEDEGGNYSIVESKTTNNNNDDDKLTLDELETYDRNVRNFVLLPTAIGTALAVAFAVFVFLVTTI